MKYLIISIILFICLSCSTKNVNGIYETKYKEYDGTSFQLDINCNGTAYIINKYQTWVDTTKGKWVRTKDTLTITYDSVKFQRDPSRKMLYKISNRTLTFITYSKSEFNKAIEKMKSNGYTDSLNLEKFKMFKNVNVYNKYINFTPVDFKNNYRNQYFSKNVKINCE